MFYIKHFEFAGGTLDLGPSLGRPRRLRALDLLQIPLVSDVTSSSCVGLLLFRFRPTATAFLTADCAQP